MSKSTWSHEHRALNDAEPLPALKQYFHPRSWNSGRDAKSSSISKYVGWTSYMNVSRKVLRFSWEICFRSFWMIWWRSANERVTSAQAILLFALRRTGTTQQARSKQGKFFVMRDTIMGEWNCFKLHYSCHQLIIVTRYNWYIYVPLKVPSFVPSYIINNPVIQQQVGLLVLFLFIWQQ